MSDVHSPPDVPWEDSTSPSPPPRMNVDDLGDYYMHDDGSVWRLALYAASPTARLDRVSPDGDLRPKQLSGCVGAPVFAGFRKLVREEAA